MSALNHTAPRFRSHAAPPMGMPLAPPSTLDVPPRLAAALATPIPTPLATPLAPPPPPPIHMSSSQPHIRSERYAGVDHTLGPIFSDEEDGDDSDYIAAKMTSLGLDSNRTNGAARYSNARQDHHNQHEGMPSEFQRRQFAQQQLLHLQMARQQQQQQLEYRQQNAALHNLLRSTNNPQQIRELLALAELQRAQEAATTPHSAYAQQFAAQQLLNQQVLQQQIMALQAQQMATAGHRQALAAQLEAGTLRREREREREMRSRPLSPDNSRMRAAFEGAQSGYFPTTTFSPPIDSAVGVGWSSTMGKPAPAPSSHEWPFGWNQAPHHHSLPSSKRTPPPTSSTSSSIRAPSPPSLTPPPSAPAVPLGRFARTRQELAEAQAAAPGAPTLATFLSRRRQTDDDALSTSSYPDATSPMSETAPSIGRGPNRKWSAESGRKVSSDLGHVDPASYLEWGYRAPAPRSQSFSVSRTADDHKPRLYNHIAPAPTHAVSYVTRQPYGPPGSPEELAQKNFASRIRRKVGQNLGMLTRRTEITDV
ncbi:hypothetical protein CspHIS471_0606980 [Cutaneotrichosporon sp. HIS471]|nr:hypothetical protein CspHIS471_0606980 [Cutaneotrichosporon sp. HIS471]